MKHHVLTPLALVLVIAACAARAEVRVGETAPDFSLPDLDGQVRTLSDLRGHVVVLEWINPNCPFSRRHAEEKTMTSLAESRQVVWLAINSTAESSGDYLTPAQHAAYDEKEEIAYPVLYDTSGDVGHTYGAKTTPHMFVIDEAGEVVYAGAIDDDPYDRKGEKRNFVAMALDAHARGEKPDPPSTKPYGCTVKYGG
jgi:peroxiredoxin